MRICTDVTSSALVAHVEATLYRTVLASNAARRRRHIDHMVHETCQLSNLVAAERVSLTVVAKVVYQPLTAELKSDELFLECSMKLLGKITSQASMPIYRAVTTRAESIYGVAQASVARMTLQNESCPITAIR